MPTTTRKTAAIHSTTTASIRSKAAAQAVGQPSKSTAGSSKAPPASCASTMRGKAAAQPVAQPSESTAGSFKVSPVSCGSTSTRSKTQPVVHPFKKFGKNPQIKKLKATCYNCDEQVSGNMALTHLFFGPIKCMDCTFVIAWCSDFQESYQSTQKCANGSTHSFAEWKDQPWEFLQYFAHRELSISKFCMAPQGSTEYKTELANIISSYLEALAPLKEIPPWSTVLNSPHIPARLSELKTVSQTRKIAYLNTAITTTKLNFRPQRLMNCFPLNQQQLSPQKRQLQNATAGSGQGSTEPSLKKQKVQPPQQTQPQSATTVSAQGNARLTSPPLMKPQQQPSPQKKPPQNNTTTAPTITPPPKKQPLQPPQQTPPQSTTRVSSQGSREEKQDRPPQKSGQPQNTPQATKDTSRLEKHAQQNTTISVLSPGCAKLVTNLQAKKELLSPQKPRPPQTTTTVSLRDNKEVTRSSPKKPQVPKLQFLNTPKQLPKPVTSLTNGSTETLSPKKQDQPRSQGPLEKTPQPTTQTTPLKKQQQAQQKSQQPQPTTDTTPLKKQQPSQQRSQQPQNTTTVSSEGSKKLVTSQVKKDRLCPQKARQVQNTTAPKKVCVVKPVARRAEESTLISKGNKSSQITKPKSQPIKQRASYRPMAKRKESIESVTPPSWYSDFIPSKVLASGNYLVILHPTQTCPDECPKCYFSFCPEMAVVNLATCVTNLMCPECHLIVYLVPRAYYD